MTTLSSMSIINDNGNINYKVVFEKTKCQNVNLKCFS